VSRHNIVDKEKEFVFGWDQPLMSFYLQVLDLTLSEDEQIVIWLGSTGATAMYEVEHLVRVARKHGLDIPYETQVKLYEEKDDGL
jgi:hypothetical protein